MSGTSCSLRSYFAPPDNSYESMKDKISHNRKEQSAKRQGMSPARRRPYWRFEDLEIWKKAVDLAVKFHLIAERLDKRRLYRYAEQLRAAGLSISNNIAEGSGSVHKQEFIQFLNITRWSLFEDASMLLVFERLGLVESMEVDELLWDCDEESRKITSFSRKL
jgi:four helix bundle protein